MNKVWKVCLALLVITLLSACQSQKGSGVQAPAPEAGTSTVVGLVLSKDTGDPVVDTAVNLADVYREGEGDGAFVWDIANSPSTVTDDKGQFIISNIEPGEYILVVGDPIMAYEIILGNDGRAKVWTAEVDKVLDSGVHKVSLNQ